jgi:hypothetical protein
MVTLQLPALVLCPQAPTAPAVALIGPLQAAGFVGRAFSQGVHTGWLPGPAFSQLLTFLGCAPTVNSQPGADNFYYVDALPHSVAPRFLGGPGTRIPRCPHCREALQHCWRDWLSAWASQARTQPSCPHCAQAVTIPQLNWRGTAGFATTGLRVCGVYEGEAVPSDALLSLLQQHSGVNWGYFYYLP